MEARRNACRIIVGKTDRKRPLRRRRRRWVDNIKMDLQEIGWGGMVWINLAQERDQWMTCEHGEPSGYIKCWEVLE
jgi:hypothetical protein